MRFLAFTVALLAGPALSLGIGEFEKQIAAETTIAGKIALAEKAFDTIEGFVPRELFMSYWSIDALDEIAGSYKAILDAEGTESLVTEYPNISRICAMEMGDYRYFFEPLKSEIEALLKEASKTKRESERIHPNLIWSEDTIKSLIDFWVLSGQAKGTSAVEALLEISWSETDIAHWDLLLTRVLSSPSELIDALETEILNRHDPLAFARSLESYKGNGDSDWWVPSISTSQSVVSTGGPRLD